MEFDQFCQTYGSRLRAYVRRYRRAIGAPMAFFDDLHQTALLTVHRKLPGWRANAGRNPFNFVLPSVRAEMWYEWRRHEGYKPYAQGAMDSSFVEFEQKMSADRGFENAEVICDMRREFATHPRPSHLVRFVMVALSPASAAELGRAIGLTRQCVSSHVRSVRKELAEALG